MYHSQIPGPQPEAFIWASGIENTFVPQARLGMRSLDEYELIGHYDHWREDLACAHDLGVQALRWGVPWYRVEPRQGQFDWSWTDQVLPYLVEDLGITPIIDLMHYGTPLWMQGSFADPAYPRAVAAYAGAFATRYRGLVRWYTPLNEPFVNADCCGRRGIWPPYLRGDSGFLRVITQLARGIVETAEAIRLAQPDALLVHVEATGISRVGDDDLQPLAADEMLRRYLATDLITGRVTRDHPLFSWLTRAGVRLADLRDLARRPVDLDILGLNFYPQWSTRRLSLGRAGRVVDTAVEQDGAGFSELVRLYHHRYKLPIMITETSVVGGERLRAAWLDSSLAQIRALRAEGVPVLGYTWFPLFTMIDWRYRFGKEPVERYRLELGMYRLQDSGPRWAPTPLVEQWRCAVANPAESVGTLTEIGQAVPELV